MWHMIQYFYIHLDMLVGFEEMAMCWDSYVHNLTMASIILRNKDIHVDGKIEQGLIIVKEVYRYVTGSAGYCRMGLV